jgi:DNA repair protein RecO (recombination protein O)
VAGSPYSESANIVHELDACDMNETATGVVLRTRPLTETSLIVHWLTRDLGRLATVAKGARRPKSPFRGKLDLFYLADFSFARSRRSELHALREVELRDTHSSLRRDLGALRQAAYCATLLEQTTEMDTPLTGIYELFHELLASLSNQDAQPQTIFAFELKLLSVLGLHPDWAQTKLTAGSLAAAKALSAADWPLVARLNLSAGQTTELTRWLHGFLIYHLGRIPKGREAAVRG